MMIMVTSSNKWRLKTGQEGFTTTFPSLATINTRKRIERVRVLSVKNSKTANLSAAKKQRILLPISEDGYRMGEFVNHPSGIEAMLNSNSLVSYEWIDANTYRCILPKLQLLNIEAAPVMDLRVIPTEQDCTIEMLSCKLIGSEILENQNEHFSGIYAFMTNRVTWNTTDSEPFLEADLKLNFTLELYTAPFTYLPPSAVEGPGNLMMQALVDRLVTLLLQQILRDYDKWANQQSKKVP